MCTYEILLFEYYRSLNITQLIINYFSHKSINIHHDVHDDHGDDRDGQNFQSYYLVQYILIQYVQIRTVLFYRQ
jgi:hypothetical protein